MAIAGLPVTNNTATYGYNLSNSSRSVPNPYMPSPVCNKHRYSLENFTLKKGELKIIAQVVAASYAILGACVVPLITYVKNPYLRLLGTLWSSAMVIIAAKAIIKHGELNPGTLYDKSYFPQGFKAQEITSHVTCKEERWPGEKRWKGILQQPASHF